MGNPNLHEFLEALDINASDAKTLFCLLDYDQSDAIDTEEFIEGCFKLRGEAKSFDVLTLLRSNERNMKTQTAFINFVQVWIQQLDQKLSASISSLQSLQGQYDKVITSALQEAHELKDVSKEQVPGPLQLPMPATI